MTIYNTIITFLVICSISCKNTNLINPSENETKIINKEIEECPITDSLKSLSTEYQGIKFYTENTMRGDGVLNLFIEDNMEILNMDKSLFGTISLKDNSMDNSYNLILPKTIVAREILPQEEYRIFNFDSELPEKNNDYLVVYINKEKRLIKKKSVNYEFESWEKYIKSAFIQEQNDKNYYWYKVLKIKNDSMQIKTVNKNACDYIQNYNDQTKWIKWRNKNCKLIDFNFCY